VVDRVELIYQESCPNVYGARAALREALRRAGCKAEWAEWERSDADAPARARLYGSLSILVDGRDVAGAPPGDGSESCRVYGYGGASQGVPPAGAIVAALEVAGGPRTGWSRALTALPGPGVALFPAGACPACWPAYAGPLGSLGLGFLALALLPLGYRARERRGFGPLGLGVVATAAALLGKFAVGSSAILYAGLALLIGASIWNTWPLSAARTGTCGQCAPQGSAWNEPGARRTR